MKCKCFSYLIVLLIFNSCTESQSMKNVKIESLNGVWKYDGKELYEQWKVNDSGVLLGKVLDKSEPKTKVVERAKIYKFGDKIVYEADVKSYQLPTFFNLVSKENPFVFENKNHDYPNSIAYDFKSNEKIKVTLADNAQENVKHYTLLRLE